MRALFDMILDLLYPPKCMLCERLLDGTEKMVCAKCSMAALQTCEENPEVPYFQRTVAAFIYQEPISDAILRFKFHGMQSYAAQFAVWMAETVRDKLDGSYDLISWAPCSRRRVWSRGFDQAELLARALANELNAEAIRTLVKCKHNRKQSKTNSAAERRVNVLGVYRPYKAARFQGKRILLIDDIITTGATVSECGKTLRLAGAGELVCAALAAACGDHNK